MAEAFEIPLVPGPQRLSVQLAGVPLQLLLAWNRAGGWWAMTVSDSAGRPLACSIPLVPGLDLLAQHRAALAVPGALVVEVEGDPGATPGYADLGGRARLYFVAEG